MVDTATKELRLTLRQERFVLEYIASGNATEAARLAGYANPNMHSARMMVNDRIVKAIEVRRSVVIEDLEAKVARYVAALEKEALAAGNNESSRIRSLELLLKVAGGFAPQEQVISTFSGGFLADIDLEEPDMDDFGGVNPIEIKDLH
jgi:phage terminase small subunit|tara:strand:- start:1277 stop:1720 length:444 start_codon:yes stop_codon:yes gene_type:complete